MTTHCFHIFAIPFLPSTPSSAVSPQFQSIQALCTNSQSTNTPLSSIPPYVDLLQSLVDASATFPAFEREAIHPILGKLSLQLVRVLERTTLERVKDWTVIVSLMIIYSWRWVCLCLPWWFYQSFHPATQSLIPVDWPFNRSF